MDTKELRIGNAIESDGAIRFVSSIEEDGYISSNELNHEYSTAQYISGIKPIPITDDIKEKLGFSPESIDPYFIKSTTKIPEHIKFVHQLQNFVFANFDEELPIHKLVQ